MVIRFYLSHWIPHSLTPDQVQMKMKYRLPAVYAGVRDQAIPAF